MRKELGTEKGNIFWLLVVLVLFKIRKYTQLIRQHRMNMYIIHSYCLSALKLRVRFQPVAKCTRKNFMGHICQRLLLDWCFSLEIQRSSTNKTDIHDITEILLKVALNTINPMILKPMFPEIEK